MSKIEERLRFANVSDDHHIQWLNIGKIVSCSNIELINSGCYTTDSSKLFNNYYEELSNKIK